jgi:type I restriction enzyme R subunit
MTIEDALDLGLPMAYTPELYQQKCATIFDHFYVSYPEREQSIYAGLE